MTANIDCVGAAGHTSSVPFQGRRVEVQLCLPADLLVLTDFFDNYLAGDYHFKRRHMQGILERGTSATWAVLVDGVMSGVLIIYKGSTLHNMYLAPDIRGSGIGAALIKHFRPAVIRAKTNMKEGDPVPFYEANGYHAVERDPLRPHITVMHANGHQPPPPAPPPASADEATERRRVLNRERARRLRAKRRDLRLATSQAPQTVERRPDAPTPPPPPPADDGLWSLPAGEAWTPD